MGQVLWIRHFLAAQGQHVPTTTIYQVTRALYCYQKTAKHQLKKDMSYQHMLFLHSRIKKGEVKVVYCTNMLEDLFTKPLQGSTFKKMRNVILNLPDTDKANAEHRSVLENEKRNKEKNDNKNQRKD